MKPGRHVYFVKPVGMEGPIKIGCTVHTEERIIGLSVWSPFKLELMVAIPGDYALERNIHNCFADLHSHREWFEAGDRLVSAIEKLKAGVPVDQAINLADKRGTILMGSRAKKPPKPGHEGLRGYETRLRHAGNRADKIVGERTVMPDQVNTIIDRWKSLHGWPHKPDARRPTPAEFAYLDEVIAAPSLHSILYAVKYADRIKAAKEKAEMEKAS